ncbi:MAG: sigma-70 family RNA polymerase sigma factor [Bacteroidota bacterium]
MEVNSKLTFKAQKDWVLVQKALQGDQKAYAQLMDNYQDTLHFMLFKMTNNELNAEDLTIEAFGKAFKNLHLYAPEYAFSTWLFRIATNNCIDFIRKNRLEIVSIDNPSGEEADVTFAKDIPDLMPNPEKFLIQKQKIKVMQEVVKKLKPHYRHLVELRYFKEYSYEEISTELNMPLGTVKAKLFRARDLLYQVLKDSHEMI